MEKFIELTEINNVKIYIRVNYINYMRPSFDGKGTDIYTNREIGYTVKESYEKILSLISLA